MKKLIKNEICGSMNSAYMHCSRQKDNICGYCSLNSNRNTPKRVKTKTKKKKKKRSKTQLGNADLESKHTLSQFVFSQVTIRSKGHFLFFILFNFLRSFYVPFLFLVDMVPTCILTMYFTSF